MNLNSVQAIFFSPTKNTKKYCLRLAYYLGAEISSILDLTTPEARKTLFPNLSGNLILVGAPIYAGRIPEQFTQSLRKIEGNNRLCIALAINGNVNVGDSLAELVWVLRNQGFKVIAAASFTGRHSFSHEHFPLAIERPDEEDFQQLKKFCAELSQKIKEIPDNPTENQLNSLEIHMEKPNIDESVPHPQYRAQKMALAPNRDEDKCISCKECYAACPVNAIDFISLEIDENVCIRCFACVRTCKYLARNIQVSLPPNLKQRFEEAMKKRLNPYWIL